MSVALNEKHERLRFDIGEIGVGSETVQDGVARGQPRQGGIALALFTKIPFGATVHARLDIPTELNTNVVTVANGAIQQYLATLPPQPYLFEHAPDPSFTAGFVAQQGRGRVLVTDGTGKMQPWQKQPAWALFAPTQAGSLVQRGKLVHTIPMPGSAPSDSARGSPHLLRLRWQGTPVAAQAMGVGTAAKQTIVFQLLNGAAPAKNIAPGSIVGHFTRAGDATNTFRDNGKGRVVGVANDNSMSVDGTIDYLQGILTVTFFAPGADAAAITVDFEHSCLYQPIDAFVSWDMDAQRGDQ